MIYNGIPGAPNMSGMASHHRGFMIHDAGLLEGFCRGSIGKTSESFLVPWLSKSPYKPQVHLADRIAPNAKRP